MSELSDTDEMFPAMPILSSDPVLQIMGANLPAPEQVIMKLVTDFGGDILRSFGHLRCIDTMKLEKVLSEVIDSKSEIIFDCMHFNIPYMMRVVPLNHDRGFHFHIYSNQYFEAIMNGRSMKDSHLAYFLEMELDFDSKNSVITNLRVTGEMNVRPEIFVHFFNKVKIWFPNEPFSSIF